MTDYATFKRGGTAFPLTTSGSNSLLQDADPSMYQAIAFLKGVLEIHIAARLVAEAATAGLVLASGAAISAAVMQAVPFDPRSEMTVEQYQFPLLAMWREEEKFSRHTISKRKSVQKWGALYAMPPMTPAQMERVGPILRAASAVLDDRITVGHDPAYSSDAHVWALAGLMDVELVSGKFGRFSGEGFSPNLIFPAWQGEITLTERQMPVTGAFGSFAGADVSEDIKDGDGTTLSDVVQFKSDVTVPGPG